MEEEETNQNKINQLYTWRKGVAGQSERKGKGIVM